MVDAVTCYQRLGHFVNRREYLFTGLNKLLQSPIGELLKKFCTMHSMSKIPPEAKEPTPNIDEWMADVTMRFRLRFHVVPCRPQD